MVDFTHYIISCLLCYGFYFFWLCRKDMREQHADKEWMALLPAVGSDLEDTKAGKVLLQRW